MTRRFAVLLLPLALVAVACNGGDDTAPTTLPPQTSPPLPTTPPELTTVDSTSDSTGSTTTTGLTTTTSGDGTTTSSTMTVTTVDDTTVTTQPGEPDWVAIVQGLYDTLDDINADPSIERIDEFCVDVESPCRDEQGAQIEALVRDGWRVVDVPRTEVVAASLNFTADEEPPLVSTLVAVDVELGPPTDGGRILDSDGNLLFEIVVEPSDGRETWFMRHLGGGEWRVFEIG